MTQTYGTSSMAHFMCDCGYAWHGLEVYIDRDTPEDIPIVMTVIGDGLSFKDKLRAIWHILRGRQHILHEVYIARDEVQDFVAFVKKLGGDSG